MLARLRLFGFNQSFRACIVKYKLLKELNYFYQKNSKKKKKKK